MLQRRLIKEGISAYRWLLLILRKSICFHRTKETIEDSGVKSKDFKTENVNLKIKQYSRKLVESWALSEAP